jgi:hypothetical protein
MSWRSARLVLLMLAGATGCAGSSSSSKAPKRVSVLDTLPPDRRDAALLGREVFRLADRAADYKGSHLGHPPTDLRQMGVESLAPLVVRRIRVVSDSSVVTVAFREPRGRTVASCEGTPQILEEATLNGGTFSVVCTTASGTVARYQVPAP